MTIETETSTTNTKTVSHLRASPRNSSCFPMVVQEVRRDGVKILSRGAENMAASRLTSVPEGAAFVKHEGWDDRAMGCSHRVWDSAGNLLYYYCR